MNLLQWRDLLCSIDLNQNLHQSLYTDSKKNIVLAGENESKEKKLSKLSLSQIVDHSKQLLQQARSTNQVITSSQISRQILLIETSDVNFKDNIIDSYKEPAAEAECFDKIKLKLKEMSKKACENRTQEKAASWWGFFKYYIYFLLYDQTSNIEKLTFKNISNEIRNQILDQLKDRIIINITSFYDREKIDYKMEIDLLAENFKNPSLVKNDFLVKYHPDKYPKVKNKDSADNIKRIITLYNLWNEFLTSDKNGTTLTTENSQKTVNLIS